MGWVVVGALFQVILNLFSYNFTPQIIAYLHLHVWEFQKFGQEYPYKLMFLVSFP